MPDTLNNLPKHISKHLRNLLTTERIFFKLSKARKSKFGDYRYDKFKKSHTISVNMDLNPYAFTITFLHEIAHKTAFSKYGFKIQPHGKEWKSEFQNLLVDILALDFFPEDIKPALLDYLNNPKATSSSSPKLMKALAKYDNKPGLLLENIKEGEVFSFQNKDYKKIKKRRTRSLCENLKTKKKYLILETTIVLRK